jgi:tetratricopeptide (TPR) repeat protein
LGRYDEALQEIDIWSSLDPAVDNRGRKADIFFCQGDLVGAEKIINELGNQVRKIRLRLIRGRFNEAAELLERQIELMKKAQNKRAEASAHRQLARLQARTSQLGKGLESAKIAVALALEIGETRLKEQCLFTLAIIQARTKLLEDADRTASDLKSLIENDIHQKAIIDEYYYVAGTIAYERQNYPEALDHFEKALALQPGAPGTYRAYLIDSLARTYEGMGDTARAKEEYEKITNLTTGRLFYPDIYVKAFYKLGQTYEQKGVTPRAIVNYEKFLDLWKDADPGIAEVEDARERLAGLKGNKRNRASTKLIDTCISILNSFS